MVDGPEDAPPETVAVEIRGDSLGPGFDGWRAFYAERHEPFLEEWINKLCVVGTADDRVLIKWVRRGTHGYNLISGTGAIGAYEPHQRVAASWRGLPEIFGYPDYLRHLQLPGAFQQR